MEDENNKKYFYINCRMTVIRLSETEMWVGMALTLLQLAKYNES